MAHIKKHDLKKDELALWIHDAIEYVKKNPTKIQTYGGITVGILIGGIILWSAVSTSIKNVRGQFSQAQVAYQQCVPGEKDGYKKAKEVFSSIINKYGFTKEAKFARFYKGACCYYLGELDDAMGCFEEFLEKYPKHPLSPAAYCRIGNIYEQKKEFQKAIDSYKMVLKNYSQSFEIQDASLSLGRCYQRMGNVFEAKKMYGKVMKNSGWSNEARFWWKNL
jgi:TolA-binding protein